MLELSKKKRAAEVLKRLEKIFPDARCELNFKNTFELMVAVQLSAQCTDKRVNEITPVLFRRVKNWEDLSKIPQTELEQLIFSSGFYRNKSKNLIGAAKIILKKYGGKLPQTMQELLTIPGVARKTANVVLDVGFGMTEGVVVDTHVHRIANLLTLSTQKTPEKIEKDLMKIIPKKDWGKAGMLFVWHGRRTCIARRPDCDHCVLSDICPGSKASLQDVTRCYS